jgi:hypothetical protein
MKAPIRSHQNREVPHAANLRQAAIEAARLIREEPGTSFRERPWGYIASGLIVIGILGLFGLLFFAVSVRPPPAKRAFVPDWSCEHYGDGAEVCEHESHTSEPKK